jgi:hypothetical protein
MRPVLALGVVPKELAGGGISTAEVIQRNDSMQKEKFGRRR